ncbi:hypothetical protein HELRODRAFT_114357 [Helobdella robusta]|uniref:long-chain-fatty-acid--CoA ligase n=1 Tax=Helobdella robusta TaxID=6412 RepID=T1EG09_HELRO|nr:hypothetical protein HELRODRAFT_114357 [Helobdella robusta]ESN97284.1 hypothetical protein HELRODRAFT_114357 [Helobdella robusta]
MRVSNNGPFLGHRCRFTKQYVWQTYEEIFELCQDFGSALIYKGLKPEDSTVIGIYSHNCVEWNITSETCSMFSMALVPLYDTLGPEACQYIINQTEMTTVVCEGWLKANLILNGLKQAESRTATPLKRLIIITNKDFHMSLKDSVRVSKHFSSSPDLANFADADSLSKNVLETAEKFGVEIPPTPSTINLISYTSGTTGDPKGVVLTHEAVICNISGLLAYDQHHKLFPKCGDFHLSYLPAAHGFERMNQIILMINGGQIGFSSGDILLLLDDIAALRPTIFMCVPRVLNRVYEKVMSNLENKPIKRWLFNFGMQRKLNLLKRGIITKNTIWDKLMFHKIQTLFGGRLEVCISGSAPLSDVVMDFCRGTFGCFVYEGYGQTELCAATMLTLPYEHDTVVVGPPLPNCHIKLIDIPDLDYKAINNMGEICIKSFCRMREYFKEPIKTRETLDEDSYIHTGDVGMWLPNGNLRIIDRRKHVFKLAQGEYVAPEKIENIYAMSPLICQVFVDGNSLQFCPLAVVVPDEDALKRLAERDSRTSKTICPIKICNMEQFCKNEEIRKMIHADMLQRGKKAGLKGFEQVKDIHLHPEKFSIENGLLTPTMKTKRPILRKKFQNIFVEMYEKLNRNVVSTNITTHPLQNL